MGIRSLGETGNAIVDHGKYGVTLFFVVSAYSLCLSVAPAFAGAPVDWRAFYIRRYFRIMPLFYAVIAVVAAVEILWIGTPASHIGRIVFNHVTLLSTFDPSTRNNLIAVEWSIFVEFLFYFLFPFVLAWLIAAPTSMLVFTLILMWPPTCEAITNYLGISQPNFTLFWHFHSFLAGMLAYRWISRDRVRRPLIGASLFLAAVALSVLAISRNDHRVSITAVSLAAAFTIGSAHYGSWLANWLRWRPLVFLGTISFSVYLLHALVLRALGGFGSFSPITGAIALAVTVGLSWCTYRAIELPGQAFARRLISGRPVHAM